METKAVEQINFARNLVQDGNTTMSLKKRKKPFHIFH